jgi:nicotinamide-nucleotide amidase
VEVEFVSVGDELLLGFTVDTNAAHFGRVAADRGIAVVRRATVGDDFDAIGDTVREALDRTGAVITCGGLGPTADDLTKPAVAALFGRALALDEGILASLRRRWKARGLPGELPETNRAQAMIPEGAEVLANAHGSAPGIWLEDARGRWVAMLPGVPREFKGMVADTLLPRLTARLAVRLREAAGGDGAGGTARGASADPTVIRSRTLRTTGVAESALADALGPLAKRPHGVPLAFMPGWEGVDLRLTVRDLTSSEADATLARAAEALRGSAGRWIYGEDEDDLAALVLDRCKALGYRVAVAESCTGGMLGMRLTAVPGSSAVVLGGTIAYDNGVKVRELGVREGTLAAHGAVSEEVAREMASGARARFGCDVAVSITGIAGPDGGTPEKPVGTFCIAVDVRGTVRSARATTVGDRQEVRQRSAQAALRLIQLSLA